jgi:hypothetical protein
VGAEVDERAERSGALGNARRWVCSLSLGCLASRRLAPVDLLEGLHGRSFGPGPFFASKQQRLGFVALVEPAGPAAGRKIIGSHKPDGAASVPSAVVELFVH